MFARFACAEDAERALSANINGYEVIERSRPRRLYVDCEWDDAAFSAAVFINAVVAAVASAFVAIGAQLTGVRVQGSTRASADWACGTKASFHLIFEAQRDMAGVVVEEVFFADAVAMKTFVETRVRPLLAEYVSSKANGKKVEALDMAPYTSFQNWRQLGQSKRGSDVTLRDAVVDGVSVGKHATLKDGFAWVGAYDDRVAVFTDDELGVASPAHIPRGVKLATGTLATAAATHAASPVRVATEEHLASHYGLSLSEVLPLIPADAWLDNAKGVQLVWNAFAAAPDMETTPNALYTAWEGRRGTTDRGFLPWIVSKCRACDFSRTRGIHSLVAMAEGDGAKELRKKMYAHSVADAEKEDDSWSIPITARFSLRYLPSIPEGKTVLISSALGTGKTTAIRKMLSALLEEDPYARVLVVTPRRTYATYIGGELKDLGFTCYLDEGWRPGDNCTIVQCESLHRLATSGTERALYDVVILDESESILSTFASTKTHGINIMRNHTTFEDVVKNAEKVVVCDAFVMERTCAFVTSVRGECVFHVNDFKPSARDAVELKPYIPRGKHVPVANKVGLTERMLLSLADGRKCVLVSGSKRFADNFVKECLEGSPYAYRSYTSTSSRETRDELKDVAKHWAGLDILIYTTSITVGVSFDLPHFDELFCYFTAASATPREYAQALLRVRQIKYERLTYVLETRVPRPPAVTLEETRAYLARREALLKEGFPEVWGEPQPWVVDNFVFNVSERFKGRACFEACVNRFLDRCGYTRTSQTFNPVDEGFAVKLDAGAAWPDWDDVAEISDEHAAEIAGKERRGDTVTAEEKFELKKLHFGRMFVEGAPKADIWETCADDSVCRNVYNCSEERKIAVDAAVSRESRTRYATLAEDRVHKRIALAKLLAILGMANSCQAKTFTAVEFSALVPALAAEEKALLDGFGLRATRREEGEEFAKAHALDLVKRCFEGWSGAKVAKSAPTRSRVRGDDGSVVRVQVYGMAVGDAEHEALWESLSCKLATTR